MREQQGPHQAADVRDGRAASAANVDRTAPAQPGHPALRRRRVRIEHLYLPTPESDYYHRNGVNPYALIAFVPAAVLSLTLAVVPAFSAIAPFGWFIGAAAAAVVYFPIARGRLPLPPEARTDEPAGPATDAAEASA